MSGHQSWAEFKAQHETKGLKLSWLRGYEQALDDVILYLDSFWELTEEEKEVEEWLKQKQATVRAATIILYGQKEETRDQQGKHHKVD